MKQQTLNNMKTNKNRNFWRMILVTLLLVINFGAKGELRAPADAFIGQCTLGDARYGWSKMTRASVYLIAVDGNKMGVPRSNQQYLIMLKVYDLPKTGLPAMNQKYRDKGVITVNPLYPLVDNDYQLGTVHIDYGGPGKYSYLYFIVADYLLEDCIRTCFMREIYDPITRVYYYTDKGEKVIFTIKPNTDDPMYVYRDFKRMYKKRLDYWEMPADMINDF